MLEVNDFNAIRISLASPEQIRSWSYGEVTKPETINYRTLKPEKDGLFCERIFGPTKDWECYCGKFKRVRYKGIVCDKCGVEVARAKVRRERMGHIELAAPVSHIWYVKGTPSRVGLLLDMSPRSLERVLYFAQYIITNVDEEARQREFARIEFDTQAEIDRLEASFTEEAQERKSGISDELESINEQHNQELAAAMEEAKALENRLRELLHKAAPETFTFNGSVVIPQDAAVTEDTLATLRDLTERRIDDLQEKASVEKEGREVLVDGETDQRRAALDIQIEKLRSDAENRQRELETLAPLQLLTESRYRELKGMFPKVFRGGMGAEAVREIVCKINLDKLAEELRREIRLSSGSGQRRKKATKRLRVVEAFRKSGSKPEWMIMTVLPVLPPDLRPMVQLDGGRFATSDLNDLYRRVINRNNRLRRLQELGAPEIIVRNEMRMLQEAVDSLIDNGRRGRAVSGSSNHKLKSLSDMLKGKRGRFRQNLLGKRVDYSGRSVIVVGPDLKLHQCGLPKKMALELFKPFVMRRLVERGFAHNIKSAKRIVERVRPEVWDVLEEVTKDHPVMLNRAPTLHRLGIQAFQPVLIEGSALHIHPLVCAAFGADFDGDQMAVHVPLSQAAREEAWNLMLSTKNLLSPASGEPIVAPTLDMVLGCYYLTLMRPGTKGEGKMFANPEEVQLVYDLELIDLQAPVKVRMPATEDNEESTTITTTAGRIIFNQLLPKGMPFKNEVFDRKNLRALVGETYREFGANATAELVDNVKRAGFDFATKSGITIAIGDIQIPEKRDALLAEADQRIKEIDKQYRQGLITEDEHYTQAVEIWTETTDEVTKAVSQGLDPLGPVHMMTTSGAKGNIQQLRQMAGMRGLMTDPLGRIIALPIRSCFREGLTVLEYFISTHGARKGLADTAIRTADSGYLTRRLIDVSQDVIIHELDCGTTAGIWATHGDAQSVGDPFKEKITGRVVAARVVNEETGEIIIDRNEEVDEVKAKEIFEAGVKRVYVRSPLACQAKHGVCQYCYGRSLARGKLVEIGEAVGTIAAESIGEPGTQLTMRTFHTGGIAGLDITSGLPRVEELFEARVPKGQAIVSEIDGTVEIIRGEDLRHVKVTSQQVYTDDQVVPSGYEVIVNSEDWVEIGSPLAKGPNDEEIVARMAGRVIMENDQITIVYEDREEREYVVPPTARLRVENGQRIAAGEMLTEGAANPQDILRILGREAVQLYLVDEVQRVYRSQGVSIHDKHVEIIVRQLLRKVKVDTPGDTELLPGELVDRFTYEDINAKILAEGGEPATAQTVLLGVTKASLNTESWLAAASFQETTRVLTEAAILGKTDHLVGLKENVIIGKLIPAGSGTRKLPEDSTRLLPTEVLDTTEG